MRKLDSEHTAKLLLVNIALYALEKEKDYSRFRMTKANLRLISGRAKLYPIFLEDLQSELLSLGWTMFEVDDSEFAFIETAKLSTWPKIGRTRVESKYKTDAQIQVEFETLYPSLTFLDETSD